jgi:hypothetical protein
MIRKKKDKAGDNEHTAARVGVCRLKKMQLAPVGAERRANSRPNSPQQKQTKGNQLKNVFGVYFVSLWRDISLRYSAEGGDFSCFFFVETRDEIGNSFLAVS